MCTSTYYVLGLYLLRTLMTFMYHYLLRTVPMTSMYHYLLRTLPMTSMIISPVASWPMAAEEAATRATTTRPVKSEVLSWRSRSAPACQNARR